MERQYKIQEKKRQTLHCAKCGKTTNQYLVLERHGFHHGVVFLKCGRCKSKVIYGKLIRLLNMSIRRQADAKLQ